ncbi:hypothetical protein GWK08_05930 [Leptobacterium flavescens]|uniref:Lipoprotein n=1 Tax=Leptobacterium flavescens TaxID=472055 RepID=A0A6P0UM95_9FLAO|nr:hypothetical protein [Leptobacterium flavescens]NER12969.1 hypothetical protein [Leptobacterium flavescens]
MKKISKLRGKLWKMNKMYSCLMVLLLMVACTKEVKNDTPEEVTEEVQEFNGQLPTLAKVPSKLKTELDKWAAFKAFETEISRLPQTEADQLTFLLDELINKEKELADSDFPPKFDLPAVKSRLMVVKTFVLQTKAVVEEKGDINMQYAKMITAYNSLVKQLSEAMEENIVEEFLEEGQ